MDEAPSERDGWIARLAADPIRLRKWSWIALVVLALLIAAGRLLSGLAGGMLTALAWACVPIVALGIGVGDAFFVRHGRGSRRLILTVLAGIAVSLASCVMLAIASDSASTRVGDGIITALYVVLYIGIVVGLAGLIALGIRRGEDYVSRRIDRMSREDW